MRVKNLAQEIEAANRMRPDMSFRVRPDGSFIKGTPAKERRILDEVKAGVSKINDYPEPPEGSNLKSEEELRLWNLYIRGKPADMWLDHEMHLLCRLVKAELKLHKIDLAIEKHGYTFIDDRGKHYRNPMVGIRQSMTWDFHRLLSILKLQVPDGSGANALKNELISKRDADEKVNPDVVNPMLPVASMR
jgi:hypothetical protein